jgi:NitT/TauT family transport system substrate-binding protein
MFRNIAIAGLALIAVTASTPSPAQDALKLAIPMRGNWETAAPDLGAAKPTSTGAMPATLTQVMTGQIDIGFAVPPMGFQQLEEGRIRIIARASEVPGSQDQTVRTTIAHAAKLAKDPAVMARFIRGYADTTDWMYSSDPKVLEIYEDFSKTPPRFTQRARSDFYSKDMLDPYRISGLDAAMAEAVAGKFIAAPLTKEQLADLFRVPQRSK